MNRHEHLEWAKRRAFEQIDRFSGFAGWIAFKHDMQKHPELSDHIALEIGDEMVKMVVTPNALLNNPESLRIFDLPGPMNMRHFIEGFN